MKVNLIGHIQSFGIKPTTVDDKTVITGEVKLSFPIQEGNLPAQMTELTRGAVIVTMEEQSPKFAGT